MERTIKNNVLEIKLDFQEDVKDSDERILAEGINTEAIHYKKVTPSKTFGIFYRNEHGVILAGATGCSLFGALYIDMLWVSPHLRKKGLGRILMTEAEKIGRNRFCTFATVNTMDWQAKHFYEKLGYQVEFTRNGFEDNSCMFFLRKNFI